MGNWCNNGSLYCIICVTGIHYLGIKLVTGLKIVTGVPDAIPVIGPTVELLRGGGVGQSTLTRFYSLHTFCFTFINCCIYVNALNDRKQGISGPL
jgi:quinol-cytochrome oxidoreductase complex cytochrome b subunit